MPQFIERDKSAHNVRDTYWDLLKALLIFLVTWGHCIQFLQDPHVVNAFTFWDSPWYKGIYLFHMPLFMCVSGYFAAASIRKHGLLSLRRYAYRLLAPCVTYGLMRMGREWCMHRPMDSIMSHFTVLWFLIVMFECVCIYYLLRQYTGRVSFILLITLPVCVATACSQYSPIPCLPHADLFSYLWPFFLAGAVCNERGLQGSHIRKWFVVFMLPIFPLAFIVPKELFIYITPLSFSATALTYHLIRTCIAGVLCVGFLGLAQCLRPISRYTLVQKIGQATLAIYVMQSVMCSSTKVLPFYRLFDLSAISLFVLTLIILLVLYTLYTYLRRIPILASLLFGERK